MNDFDFEELDKAVNQLASKTHDEHGGPDPSVPLKAEPAPLSTPVAAEPPVVRSQPVTPQPPKPVESERSSSVPVVRPQKHASRLDNVRPKGGAFMDIVPPASRRTGTRAGISLQPLSKPESVVPEPPKEEVPEQPPHLQMPELNAGPTELELPAGDVSALAAPAPQPADTHREDDASWPDPLDFHADEAQKSDKPADQPEQTPSPFLAEAKVEKRPLGAFSNFRPLTDEKRAEEAESAHRDKEALPVADELTPQQNGTFEEPQQPKAPLADLKDKTPEPSEDAAPSKPDMHSAAMMAIPQQYRTEKKESDTSPRPVFDTKEYHPPLLDAAIHEHRGGGSMWGKLFIALVVLVLLGVAAYFVFLYVIQR